MKQRGNPVIRSVGLVGNGPYRRHCKRIAATVKPMRDAGKTWPEICVHLNEQALLSFRGRRWTPPLLIGAIKEAERD